MRETNCKNCGAPLKSGKCEYCGTEHFEEAMTESYISVTMNEIRIGTVVKEACERMARNERYC